MKRNWMFVPFVFLFSLVLSDLARAAALPDFTGIVERNSGAVVKILAYRRRPGWPVCRPISIRACSNRCRRSSVTCSRTAVSHSVNASRWGRVSSSRRTATS